MIVLRREHTLTDQEALTLSGWVRNYPDLGVAHRLKEEFFKIYDHKTRNDALTAFVAWDASVTPDIRWAFQDLIRVWRNWQPYILNYFDHLVTNAYTESLNNLIRSMDRRGRGYSFDALRAKMLFTESAHKHTLRRPKFERRQQRQHDVANYGVPMMFYGVMNSPHEPEESMKNYGADINTLAELFESGQL